MAINFNKVEFILSAASEKQFMRDGMPQLAFAGRSNVGKSSVINRLVNRKNFARVGASPGKTSQINYFKIDGKLYLVDLPGYGYAKVSKTERDRWGKLMESYFQSAGLIHLGVQIVDARHKPTADDVTMHDYFVQTGCPVVIVANKLDKLKAREIEPNLAQIRETLSLRDDELVIPFSAEKGTGNLGDVMQESCRAAISCLRQRAQELGIAPDFYKTKDIHIHFPEGAIPKDGPSAGIAIATAVLSALTGQAVHRDVAMTGEITLRGRVLAIGGLREKTMGALRAGVHTVILPKENEKDLDEIDPLVREKLRFVPVETVDAVFAEALVLPEKCTAVAHESYLPVQESAHSALRAGEMS